MSKLKLTVNGQIHNGVQQEFTGHSGLELKYSIQLRESQRGISTTHSIEVDTQNDIVELIFDDNTTWLGPTDVLEQFYPGNYTQSRNGDFSVEISRELEGPANERGVIGKVILKVLNIFARKDIGDTVGNIARKLEIKQLDNFKGLVGISSNFNLGKPNLSNTSKPFLLFIHGTNSSTLGSFSELLGTETWKYILNTYGTNVLGFQHETLTKSPLQNTIDLVKQLPENAEIHLVTHSRGGLIGELLCRFSCSEAPEAIFSNTEVDLLKAEARYEDVDCIKELRELSLSIKFNVRNFIRVACPTSGTTILSKRLDHFFNISLNLIGAIPALAASPIYQTMKELLIAAIDQKNDVDVLPGLEAMKPESTFIRILNNQSSNFSIKVPVAAISGNCKAKVNMRALVVIASKLFYQEANDLVVNTSSMYNGSKRIAKLNFFFDEGTDVDHFHYFNNAKTNAALLLALKYNGTGALNGFEEHSRGKLGESERNAILGLDGGQYSSGNPSGKKPIAIIFPGIMGSNLSHQNDLVWINYMRFLSGGLERLRFSTSNDVTTSSIVKSSYKKLGDALKTQYDVVTFPFDWRKSIRESAGEFSDMAVKLMKFNQPIKIIAHSMGGVLIRDFMVFHPKIWKELNTSRDFRLLFLGSPLGGSFRISNVLFGDDEIINKLGKVDIIHTEKQLLSIFCAFPGLLCLLPFTSQGDYDFSKPEVWTKMRGACGDPEWPIPSNANLSDFKAYRDKILSSQDIDYSNAAYIAGWDKHTPCGYRIDDTVRGKELIFLSTAEGDQSVTWESGIPPKMILDDNVYYVNYSHGALSCTESIFNGIKEIIATGQTNLLSRKRPSFRSEQKIFIKPVVSDFDFSPRGLEKTLMGIVEDYEMTPGEIPLEVIVSNGDLKYSSFPLIAGHFKNDGILYAESRINTLLNGILSEQYKLGLYPGDIGTYEFFVDNMRKDFSGAIIVGLGEPEKLTSFEMIRTIEHAVARHLLNVNNFNSQKRMKGSEARIGISSLFISCGYGGLTLENSINSILQGIINGNNKIRTLYKEHARLIEIVEFIELYENRAINGIHTIRNLSKENGGSLNINFKTRKLNILNGRKKQLNTDQGSEWWNRISVSKEENQKKEVMGMKFSISTGAAREDLRSVYTCTGVVEELIESISTDNNWSDEKARAVFELLIPNDFKVRLKKHGNLSWILDKYTASYPWELLQDKSKGALPLCINGGMIRHLATGNSRLNIESVSENSALVIGDPDLNGFLTQLQGAYDEAMAVSDLLKSRSYKTRELLRETHSKIIPALVSSDYKIIHLAGHGIFNADPEKPSGMVIGKNSFLTTAEIAQMSSTPELVFVNCCFLGKTDVVAEEFYQSRFKLAANIGTQLIENGVKAVIVAGWAVDDTAALVFARAFYDNLFQGKTFGEAVRIARGIIYEQFKNKNTWGAYQCYGDPFYRIDDRTTDKDRPSEDYISETEAEIVLENILSELNTGESKHEEEIKRVLIRMEKISEALEAQGISSPGITECEALILKGLNKYDKAILKYEKLLKSEDASYSLGAVEQYCNIKLKHIIDLVSTGQNEEEPMIKEFDKVIDDLEALLQISPSHERYMLKGSAYKRKLLVYKPDRKTAFGMLEEASKNYYSAANFTKNSDNIYSYINWCILEAILSLADKRLGCMHYDVLQNGGVNNKIKHPVTTWDKVIQKLKELENNILLNGNTHQYWEKLRIPNIKLCYVIVAMVTPQRLIKSTDHTMVVKSYQEVWKNAGTRDEQLLEVQNLDLFIKAVNILAPKHDLLLSLTELRNGLKKVMA